MKPNGSVADRRSSIGNPRHHYLPRYRDEIASEAYGMIARWRDAGMPLDDSRYHPCTEWARVIGGILKVNGIKGFLDNYADRLVADNPIRRGIAVLGVHLPDEWLPIATIVAEVSRLSLTDPLVAKSERGTFEAQKRGLGKVLSAHRYETFASETEDQHVKFQLEKARKRFVHGKPETRYRFSRIESTSLEADDGADDSEIA